MLKKTVTFTDYDGVERTEDFYFNLNKAELTTLFNSVSGGLEKKLDQIVKAKDGPKIMENFREILRLSYGVKSNDGRTFRKSPEIYADFEATEAYSEIFMELCTDAEAAAEFIKNVIPKDLAAEVEKQQPELLEAIK